MKNPKENDSKAVNSMTCLGGAGGGGGDGGGSGEEPLRSWWGHITRSPPRSPYLGLEIFCFCFMFERTIPEISHTEMLPCSSLRQERLRSAVGHHPSPPRRVLEGR